MKTLPHNCDRQLRPDSNEDVVYLEWSKWSRVLVLSIVSPSDWLNHPIIARSSYEHKSWLPIYNIDSFINLNMI